MRRISRVVVDFSRDESEPEEAPHDLTSDQIELDNAQLMAALAILLFAEADSLGYLLDWKTVIATDSKPAEHDNVFMAYMMIAAEQRKEARRMIKSGASREIAGARLQRALIQYRRACWFAGEAIERTMNELRTQTRTGPAATIIRYAQTQSQPDRAGD